MAENDATALVNLLGFFAGVCLYAMLLAMVLRGRVYARIDVGLIEHPSALKLPPDRLPLVAAVLGLVWNVGALVVDGQRDFGAGSPSPIINAIALVALGLLPAVVVHSAVQTSDAPGGNTRARMLSIAAYALSITAGILHVTGALSDQSSLSDSAMLLLTIGYALLMAALFIVTRRQPGFRRATWVVALSVFAVSAFHLSQHSGNESAWIALLGHHASIPLAVAILYQDYRFALVDTFLKRALSLVAIVAVAFGLYVTLGVRLLELRTSDGSLDSRAVVGLVALWIVTALAYPVLHNAIRWFVDAIVLQRSDYGAMRGDVAREIAASDDEDSVLDAVCARLASALSAERVGWNELPGPSAGAPPGTDSQVTVTIPVSDAPSIVLEIGALGGGRRLLSDDVAFLESVALIAAQRIDAIRVAHERWTRSVHEQEMSKLAAEAELRALQAQLNPHFLFNALTTIGYLIQTSPDRALETLMRLTGLLRAVLKRSSGEFATLGDEIDLVETYLQIEISRFEERLCVRIDVADELRSALVPPLVVQPLVENAVKHGIAPSKAGGEITVSATLDDKGPVGRVVVVSVHNTGADAVQDASVTGTGVGLTNIRTRLERYYSGTGSLEFSSSPGNGTRATLRIPYRTGTGERIAAQTRTTGRKTA